MTITQFQHTIWKHYRTHKKTYNFPWRNTRDPYKILVSEIMLQQTQISRVQKKYREWLHHFPSLSSLARAPFSRVFSVWSGLGYNRRARHFANAARIIQNHHNGTIPQSPEKLQSLPGIGPYTAHAVSCFAYGNCSPFLDTNIRRVFIHFFFSKKQSVHDSEIREYIKKAEPTRNKREWYYALMDYGRDVLGKQKTKNPNRKSAGYTKQSPFKGSTRYVRAKICRLLLQKNALTTKQIQNQLKKDAHAKFYARKDTLPPILTALSKESLISKKQHKWRIAIK